MNFDNISNDQLTGNLIISNTYIGFIYSNTVSSNYLSTQTGGTVNSNVNILGKLGIGTTEITASNLYVSADLNTAILGKVGIGTTDTSTYALNIAGGDVAIGNNLIINGFLNQTNLEQSNIFLGKVGIGTSTISCNLTVSGNSYFNGKIGIGGTDYNSNLAVTGKSYFSDAVAIGTTDPGSYKLNVSGDLKSTNIYTTEKVGIGGTDFNSNLAVTGKSYFSDAVAIGTTDPGSYKLNVSGDLNASNIYTSGKIGIGGTNFNSNLAVTGNSYLNGNVGIGTNDSQIYRLNVANGDVKIASNMNIDGSIFQNTLSKSNIFLGNVGIGGTDYNSNLAVTGNSYFKGNIVVTGTITGLVNQVDASQATVFIGNIGIGTADTDKYKLNIVGGDVRIASNLYVNYSILQDNSSKSNIFLGNVGIGGTDYNSNLAVTGKSYFSDTVAIGTTNPESYKLNINGKLNTTSLYINRTLIDFNTYLLSSIASTIFQSNLTFLSPLLKSDSNEVSINLATYYNKSDINALLDNKQPTLSFATPLSKSISNEVRIYLGAFQSNLTDSTTLLGNGSSIKNLSASNISSGTLSIERGGTGITQVTLGNILFGNSTTALNSSSNLNWDNTNSILTATKFSGDGLGLNNLQLDNNNNTPYTYPPIIMTSASMIINSNPPQNGIYNVSCSVNIINITLLYAFDNNNVNSNECFSSSAYDGTGAYLNSSPYNITTIVNNKYIAGEWIQLYYDKGFAANAYQITGLSKSSNHSVSNIVLVGSYDEKNWNLLSSNVGLPSYNIQQTFKFNLDNFTAYNYYRLIITNKVADSSYFTIRLTEFKLYGLPNSSFYNKDTFNKIIYNTNEKEFPPTTYNINTAIFLTSNEIFNVSPSSYNKQIITVNNLEYHIYVSSANGIKPSYLFDKVNADYTTTDAQFIFGMRWADSQYQGYTYKTTLTANIGNNSYLGDWIIIKFPYSIVLTRFVFWQSGQEINSAPGAWECYGSIDGVNWNKIPEASSPSSVIYTLSKYEQILPNYFNIPYLYLGWVVNKLIGNTSGRLAFNELQIFGKDDIANSYLDVWNKSNTNIYTLGNVGIGTTNPGSYKLNVSGDLKSTNIYTTEKVGIGGTNFNLNLAVTGTSYFNGNVGIGITNPSQKLHVIGEILASGDITAFSDKRLKENIIKLNDVDNIINSINGYSFNWNKKGQELLNKSDENEVGLIAQEVQSVIPSAISSNNNDGYLTLKYNKIIPYLVEGFKLLNDKYNKQQEQINKLLENK